MAKGLYSNEEVCDLLLESLNGLPKLLIDNQFIAFSKTVYDMAALLKKLKTGIKNDMDNRNKTIETLKSQLREVGVNFDEFTPDEFMEKYGKKDGANNGE